ncbi:hypothetical protein, partial [Limnohabitans sp. Bal53]|uniref:hypothetical protein n=1 Tax=Limnohabitans sp. Bal53 TaxID=1977910 RepID=UPI001E364DD3
QPDRLHLEFQRVLGPFPRFTHLVLLELIFNHQLSSTFFGGKVTALSGRLTGILVMVVPGGDHDLGKNFVGLLLDQWLDNSQLK